MYWISVMKPQTLFSNKNDDEIKIICQIYLSPCGKFFVRHK